MDNSRRPISRGEVLGFACSLSMITYLDRACFGMAAAYIVKDLGLKEVSDLKWVLTAFSLAYALFEIPSGWLGDAFGPRRTLIRIVIGWSVFTAMTGLVGLKIGAITFGGLGLLTIIRFLFGVGEAGAYPNLARVVANWFPSEDRGRAKGWIWMSGRLMGGATPLIWTVLVAGTVWTPPLVNWRGAFILFGALGILWVLVFRLRFQDHPPEKRAELAKKALEGPVVAHKLPWGLILTNKSTWFLGMMYACASFSWYFNINYYPNFLKVEYGIEDKSLVGAILKGLPLLLGGLGCLVGGYWTDQLVRRLPHRRWARRIPAMFAHAFSGVCYLVALQASSGWTAALAISMAAFANDLMMGSAWASCQDIGRKHTAVVAGWMNMLGNLGGALSGWAVGSILESTRSAHAVAENVAPELLSDAAQKVAQSEGYHYALISFVVVSFVAVFLWLPINADRSLEKEDGLSSH
jgi:MFS transporter, ACS family, glucarate transporter